MQNSGHIYRDKLEKLLEDKTEVQKYEFDRMPFILFGAGGLGVKTINGLLKLGIKLLAIGDNNPNKIGTTINGVQVLSIKEIISKYGNNIFIVLSVWSATFGKVARVSSIIKQLNEEGLINVVDITKLFNQYPEEFFPHYCLDSPDKVFEQKNKIIEAYTLLCDKKSQKEYYNQVKWRIYHNNWYEFVDVDYSPYFQDDLYELEHDDVIYDCGAYDGDTIRDIIHKSNGHFKKILSFEPDRNSYDAIIKYLSEVDLEVQHKIDVFNYAVGDNIGTLSFQANSDGSSTIINNGNCKIESITIDNFVQTKQDSIPTIIKMDIEGYEVKALVGAKNTIKKYKPILAICVYHKQNDLWVIPLLINSINKEYTFFLRHHRGDCWETVLYAIPKHRCKFMKESKNA